jgi:hypothetical protein
MARLKHAAGAGTAVTVSAFLDALPTSFSTPELNVPCAEGEHHVVVAELLARAADGRLTFPGGRVGTIDGLRMDFADGFGLIRGSNTTPVPVLRFEGHTDEALQRIEAQSLVGGTLGAGPAGRRLAGRLDRCDAAVLRLRRRGPAGRQLCPCGWAEPHRSRRLRLPLADGSAHLQLRPGSRWCGSSRRRAACARHDRCRAGRPGFVGQRRAARGNGPQRLPMPGNTRAQHSAWPRPHCGWAQAGGPLHWGCRSGVGRAGMAALCGHRRCGRKWAGPSH